jgi:hypothetical protein
LENQKERGQQEDKDPGGRVVLQDVLARTNCLLSFDMTWTARKTTHPSVGRDVFSVFQPKIIQTHTHENYTYMKVPNKLSAFKMCNYILLR